MKSRLACLAIPLCIQLLPPAARAQNIIIQGKTFYKDGKPWILKGVNVAGLSKSPRQRARDKGAAQANDYWNDAEIKAIKNTFRIDTLRLQVSPAAVDNYLVFS